MQNISKREFLGASIGAGMGLSAARKALAQQGAPASATANRGGSAGNRQVPSRKVKTTKLFKSPDGFPNAIAVTPEGLWIGGRELSPAGTEGPD
jgi:hypothetical protein